MKRFLLAISGAALAFAPTSALAKSSLEGRWRNGAMQIMIAPCGPALCGTVVRASGKQQARAERGSGTNLIGARLMKNIRPSGPGRYIGDVFVADRNMTARGTIRQVGPT